MGKPLDNNRVEDWKKHISISLKGKRKGVKFSDEHKKKIGDAHRGRILSPERKQLMKESAIRGDKHPNWAGGESTYIARRLLSGAKKRAKALHIPYNLELSDIIIPEKCPVLHIKLESSNPTNHDCAPSIDRINPNLGYIKDNIGIISMRANRLKSDASLEELEKIIKYIRGENGISKVA